MLKITKNQWLVLRCIADWTHQHGWGPMTDELSVSTCIHRSTCVGTVQQLEKAGLVSREETEGKRSFRLLKVTRKGRALLAEAAPPESLCVLPTHPLPTLSFPRMLDIPDFQAMVNEETKGKLRAIVEAWDRPHAPGWSDALYCSIEDARHYLEGTP